MIVSAPVPATTTGAFTTMLCLALRVSRFVLVQGKLSTMSIPAGASANTVASSLQPNGLNIVDVGDVITLTSDGGAANASSVPVYYTVTVDERSL